MRENFNGKKVTFVIPTIGRGTLDNSINSIKKQTSDEWTCKVVFDGVEPSKDYQEDNVKVMKVEKVGLVNGKQHGQSGLVRDFALEECDTEWVSFLDDDDTINESYVETLLTKYKDYDLVIWRMSYPNGRVIPPLNNNNIVFGNVGISISFKGQLLEDGLRFNNNRDGEDFDFIKKILDVTKNYIIADEVFYNVNH